MKNNKIDFGMVLKAVKFNIYLNNEIFNIEDELNKRIKRNYPGINYHGFDDNYHLCEDNFYRPVVFADAEQGLFKQIFGNCVKQGLAGACFMLSPIPLPVTLYKKWHQTNDLIIPDDLNDLVYSASLNLVDDPGSDDFIPFSLVDLWVPKSAKEYVK